MPPPAPARRGAVTPDDLHAIVQDAINRGDLAAFLDAHDDDATDVVPPDGGTVRGREQLRDAIAPLLALAPRMETVVVKKLEGAGLALTHGRWRLALTENGCRTELRGLGTMVSRRVDDGTWRILLDDPLTGA